MDRLMIRYKVKPDQVERHLELLRAVCQELESTLGVGLGNPARDRMADSSVGLKTRRTTATALER